MCPFNRLQSDPQDANPFHFLQFACSRNGQHIQCMNICICEQEILKQLNQQLKLIEKGGTHKKTIKFTMKMKCTEKQKKDNARREVKTKHQWK